MTLIFTIVSKHATKALPFLQKDKSTYGFHSVAGSNENLIYIFYIKNSFPWDTRNIVGTYENDWINNSPNKTTHCTQFTWSNNRHMTPLYRFHIIFVPFYLGIHLTFDKKETYSSPYTCMNTLIQRNIRTMDGRIYNLCDPSRRNGHVGGMTPNWVIDTSLKSIS